MNAALSTVAVIGLAIVGLSGCEGRSTPETPAQAAAPTVAETVQGAAVPADVAAPPTIRLEPEAVVLSPEGTVVRFGTPEAEVVRVLSARHGREPGREANGECGEGPLTFIDYGDGLRLAFFQGRLSGWWLGPDAPATYAEAGGIAVGSTLAEARRAHPGLTVSDGTVGPEFALPGGAPDTGVFGLADGAGEAARVTALYAGTACIFR